MFDDLLFALRNFKRNRIRSILSLLGVIIGVASVIVITSLGRSASKSIKDSYSSAGLDLVKISAGFMRRGRDTSVTFNEAFRTELFDAVEHITKIAYCNSMSVTLTKDDTSVNGSATAIEYGYLPMCGLTLSEGADFTVSDGVTGQQRVILGPDVAEALFPSGGAVGQKVIGVHDSVSFQFEVAGVLTESASGIESTANAIYVPRGFYAKKIQPSPNASSIVVQCTAAAAASAVAENIESFIAEKAGNSYAASVTSMQAMLEQYEQVTGTVSLLLSGIAAISLLVGGIGIMNIMIVTVTERRREIGIRKALGASPAVIRTQFLIESALITGIGGCVGIAAGIGISAAAAAAVMKWSFAVDGNACAAAFVFSAAIGIFFGFSPASRAAKLDPVEALSSE